MNSFKRAPNRNKSKVKQDVEQSKKIVREDVYDILKTATTRAEAVEAVREFVYGLDSTAIRKYTDQHRNIEVVAQRIISDIDSYGIKWEE